MRISTKGQVTIPLEIREKMGLLPHTEVQVLIKGNTVLLEKKRDKSSWGKKLVDHMRGRATVKMPTDEIMALTRGE
jgi:AbrB family looped-hinge helix DNA binding protein